MLIAKSDIIVTHPHFALIWITFGQL